MAFSAAAAGEHGGFALARVPGFSGALGHEAVFRAVTASGQQVSLAMPCALNLAGRSMETLVQRPCPQTVRESLDWDRRGRERDRNSGDSAFRHAFGLRVLSLWPGQAVAPAPERQGHLAIGCDASSGLSQAQADARGPGADGDAPRSSCSKRGMRVEMSGYAGRQGAGNPARRRSSRQWWIRPPGSNGGGPGLPGRRWRKPSGRPRAAAERARARPLLRRCLQSGHCPGRTQS